MKYYKCSNEDFNDFAVYRYDGTDNVELLICGRWAKLPYTDIKKAVRIWDNIIEIIEEEVQWMLIK